MVCANVKIIEGLCSFLELISKDGSIRELFTNQKSDFSRNRKLPFEKIVALILNFPKRSISIELREFFNFIEEPQNCCSKGAFSLQRVKLRADFFQLWNQLQVELYYLHYGNKIKRWKGFRLMAIDGSTNYLFNKPEVANYFGTVKNNHENVSIPISRVLQIQDVLNEVIVWSGMFPYKISEREIVSANISRLPSDSIALFDRGFPSYSLMYLLMNQEKSIQFVMRCRSDFNKQIRKFSRSRIKDTIIKLMPSHKAINQLKKNGYIVPAQTEILVRLVKLKLSSGETEILITNLYDHNSFTIQDLKQVYYMRWKTETSFGTQKNQLQMEVFSGHTVVSILQDYYACVFVANLQAIIEKQCTQHLSQISRKRKYTYKINKNVSWSCMKNNVVNLFLTDKIEAILLKLQKLFELNIEPVRLNRTFPRIRKIRKVLGKYKTETNYKRAV